MDIEGRANPRLPPQPQGKQQEPSILLQYPEMIMAAIEALNDPNGSNKSAISKQMEETYPDLPASHWTLLSHNLNQMKQIGQLVMVKGNYMKPDPNAPPKRGRGRPPKSKKPLPPHVADLPPARPRGRPPKPKDPFAPAPPTSSSSGTGRPRGRPPKRAKTVASAPSTGAPRRGRGRPPKAKPAVEPVGC